MCSSSNNQPRSFHTLAHYKLGGLDQIIASRDACLHSLSMRVLAVRLASHGWLIMPFFISYHFYCSFFTLYTFFYLPTVS